MNKEFVIKYQDEWCDDLVELGFEVRDGKVYFIRGDAVGYETEALMLKDDLTRLLDLLTSRVDFPEEEVIKWELRIGKKDGMYYYRRGDYCDGFRWVDVQLTLAEECMFIETVKMILEMV